MSSLKVNSVVDAAGGNTVSINGYTPTMSNMAGRNRIINGDMRIDQRNAGASVTTASGTAGYFLDRWRMDYSQTSKVTVQQNAGSVTPPVGFSNYYGLTSTSAYSITSSDQFNISQFVEGYNVADLAWGTASAATVTLSFWVRSSLTGTFGGSLSNSAFNRSYPFTYTISAANTWEQKTLTIAGDTSGTWLTSNGVGIRLYFSVGTGSTFSGTAGSWAGAGYMSATGATSVVGTSGATFYITGVQLEAGSVATPFERRPYGQELALCQRYYQQQYGSKYFYSTTGNSKVDSVQLGITMRAAPTVTKNTGSGIIGSVSVNNTFTNSVEVAGAAGTAENRELGFVLNCSSEL